jgi:hypothetical protein
LLLEDLLYFPGDWGPYGYFGTGFALKTNFSSFSSFGALKIAL